MRGRDLDPVEARLGDQRRRPCEPLDDGVDLPRRERARLDVEAEARERRRSERGRARGAGDLLPSAVEELREEPRPVRVHGVGDARQRRHDLLPVPGERMRSQQPGRVHGRCLEDDQPGASARAGLVVGDEVHGRQVLVDEGRLVGRRDDPIRELDRPDAKRAEERFEHAPPPFSVAPSGLLA